MACGPQDFEAPPSIEPADSRLQQPYAVVFIIFIAVESQASRPGLEHISSILMLSTEAC